MKNSLIIIPFNALLDDVCDYAEQTVRVLARENQVLGVALGNPLSLVRDFGAVVRGQFLIRHWGMPVLRPVMIVPFQRIEYIKRLNIMLNIFAINLWLVWQKKQKLLWFFEPRYLSRFLSSLAVDASLYDCIDYFSAYENWQSEHIYCLQKASFVVANSHTLQQKLRAVRPDVTRVPLGFAYQDMPQKLVPPKKKKVLVFGFIGDIGQRFDLPFLQQLWRRRPNDKFVFVGPQSFSSTSPEGKKQRRLFQQLLQQPNVQWLPRLSRQKLWHTARQFNVGLVPYDTHDPFNRYSFPMKMMEYFYAGLPVITTDIKELALYPKYVYQPQRQGWRGLKQFLESWGHRQQTGERKIALANTWEKKVVAIEAYVDKRMRRLNSQT